MPNPAIDQKTAQKLLTEFLEFYGTPSFGSPSKRDIDLQVFSILRAVGWVSDDDSLFSIAEKLRVTRARARALSFDHDIRKAPQDRGDPNQLIRETLINARFAKDGDYFVCDVESPYLQALVRERVRESGHVSDATFNASLIRMSVDAFADLVEGILSKSEREAVRKALVKAGAKDGSFGGVLRQAFGALGKKAAGGAIAAAAGATAKAALPQLSTLLQGGVGELADVTASWTDVFG